MKKSLLTLVQEVFDELMLEAEVQDGYDEVQHMGWLQEHDDRYHGGHYEEGQRCNLREKLGVGDNADRLDGAGRSALEQLRNAPSKAEFDALISRLREAGIIGEDEADDIARMSRSAFNALRRADDEGFGQDRELRENLLALNELYQALNAAYPQQQAAEEQVASERQQADDDVTAEQIREVVDRLSAQRGGMYRSEIDAAVRSALAGGDVDAGMLNAAAQELGEDNPIVRAVRSIQRQIGGGERQVEAPAHVREPEQASAQQPEAQTANQSSTDWLSGMNVGFGYGEANRRKSLNYEWPFNARTPVTADRLNEEMLRNVVCHLPFGVRNRWRLERSAEMAMELLTDPDRTGYGYNRILDSMLGSNNRHAQRYVAALKALHPGCIEAREQRIRDNNNRRDANNLTMTMERTDSRGEGIVPNLTEEQYREAADAVVSHVGESNRDVVERGFAAMRNGRISPEQANLLGLYLPGNSPVLSEAHRISNARLSEYERERARIEAARPHLNPPKASDEVIAQDKALCEAAQIRFKGAGSPLSQRSGNRHFGRGSSNCWHNANAVVCQLRGMDVFPKMAGHDLMSFGSCKEAMSEAYERVDVESPESFRNWFHSTQFANGDSISTWNGGHNKVFVFNEGSWYEYDGYYRKFGLLATDYSISGAMSFTSKDRVNLDGNVGHYYYGSERQKQVVLMMAKRALRRASGNMSLEPSQAELEDKAKDMLARSQGSYFIPISKPLIPEMLKSNSPE